MRVPVGQIRADFFDGETARRHPVVIEPTRDGFSLSIEGLEAGGPSLLWPLAGLRALRDQAGSGSITLTRHVETDDESPRDPARLVVSDPQAVAWFRTTRPALFAHDVRKGTGMRIAVRLGGAIAAVCLMIFVILPGLADRLAPFIPAETEARLGRAVLHQVGYFLLDGDIDELACDTPDGRAALDRMTARLATSEELGYELQLTVLDHDMVNAFALPGGQIVILRGLLDEAESADEIAGVLAHEMGHVAHRDPTRLMLRAVGSSGILSLLLGDVTGGTMIALAADHLMQASYTREAEAAADDFALGQLAKARISAEPLAGFFDRIAGETDIMPEYLSSHPLSAGRADRARAADTASRDMAAPLTPALAEADWQALRSICG